MIRATSKAQFEADEAGRVPAAEQVREGIRAVAMGIPDSGLAFNHCYLIEDRAGAIHVIDPGLPSDENWRRLEGELRSLGRGVTDVASITATHLHPDHLGMASRLRAASGASLILHRSEAAGERGLEAMSDADPRERMREWGVPAELFEQVRPPERSPGAWAFPDPDLLVDDGDALPIPGRTIVAIHTPGHTSGHICLRDDEGGVLFTGDHVLPTVHSGIGLGGPTDSNQINDYLTSLARLAPLDELEVLPGHQYRFRGLAERCASTAEHHLRRTREVAAVLDRGGAPSVWEVASQLTWSGGWKHLSVFNRVSALSQTAMHMQFVRSGLAARHLAAQP